MNFSLILFPVILTGSLIYVTTSAKPQQQETFLAVGGISHEQYWMVATLKYNVSENSWSVVNYFPRPLQSGATAAVLNNQVYACASYGQGGFWNRDPESAGTCMRWNPAATDGEWSEPDEIARLPANFTSHSMIGLGDRIYALGNPAGDTTPLLVYDPASNSWTHAEDFPASNLGGVATADGPDGKLYVAGGYQGGEGGKYVGALYAYDPAQEEWTRLADMPTARNDFALTGFVYKSGNGNNTAKHWLAAIGGRNEKDSQIKTVEFFDITANQWLTNAKGFKLNAARRLTAAVELHGYLYVVGGINYGNDLQSSEKLELAKIFENSKSQKLDGKKKVWQKIKSLNKPMAGTTLVKVKV